MIKKSQSFDFWNEVEVIQDHNIISEKVSGSGVFTFEGILFFAGKWTGEILASEKCESDSKLILAKSAQVSGKIKAKDVIIEGNFSAGEIICERLNVLSGANVSGRVQVEFLEVAEEAIFNAQVHDKNLPKKLEAFKKRSKSSELQK